MSIFFRSRSRDVHSKDVFKSSRGSLNGLEMGPDNDTPLASHGGHDLPVHPRLWLLLGLLYVSLGVTQVVLAALWRWWFGVAVGLGIMKTGTSLAGLGATGGRVVRPDAAGFLGKLTRLGLRVLLWGSAKVQQLLWRLRWLIYANGALVALMIFIHLASPDPRPPPAAFPPACPREKRFGCSRVAEGSGALARGLQPLLLESSVEFVQAAAEAWVGTQTHARVLTSSPGFFHARFVSFFWGFADDFFADFRCHNSTHVVVEAQGQLRIGTSDLGVNKRRNRRFLAALTQAAAQGAIPEVRCTNEDLVAGGRSGQQQQQRQQAPAVQGR